MPYCTWDHRRGSELSHSISLWLSAAAHQRDHIWSIHLKVGLTEDWSDSGSYTRQVASHQAIHSMEVCRSFFESQETSSSSSPSPSEPCVFPYRFHLYQESLWGVWMSFWRLLWSQFRSLTRLLFTLSNVSKLCSLLSHLVHRKGIRFVARGIHEEIKFFHH